MILVVGATGSLGGEIARRLLGAAETVRVLVRPGSAYSELVEAGAEPAVGDLKDIASLRAACGGMDAVVSTATAAGRGGDDTIDSVDDRGYRNLIQAASAEGVRHFVFVSALGAANESPVPLLQAKGRTEQLLASSGMTWTVLQPNLFMDTWLPMVIGGPALSGNPVTLVGEGRRVHSMVAMGDVVSYALAALVREEAVDARLFIGGPDAISWRDAIAAFERELGREIPVHTVAPGEPLPGMPDAVNGLFQTLETYDSPLDMSQISAAYGIPPTPVASFVHDLLARSASAQESH